LDSTFVHWNIATINSLKSHIATTKDSSVHKLYENRLKALKVFLDIKDDNQINVNSIRYQFLNDLSLKDLGDTIFYVIEAGQSGEMIEIRNYVVFLIDNGKVGVDIYNYTNEKWVKNVGRVYMPYHLNKNSKLNFS